MRKQLLVLLAVGASLAACSASDVSGPGDPLVSRVSATAALDTKKELVEELDLIKEPIKKLAPPCNTPAVNHMPLDVLRKHGCVVKDPGKDLVKKKP